MVSPAALTADCSPCVLLQFVEEPGAAVCLYVPQPSRRCLPKPLCRVSAAGPRGARGRPLPGEGSAGTAISSAQPDKPGWGSPPALQGREGLAQRALRRGGEGNRGPRLPPEHGPGWGPGTPGGGAGTSRAPQVPTGPRPRLPVLTHGDHLLPATPRQTAESPPVPFPPPPPSPAQSSQLVAETTGVATGTGAGQGGGGCQRRSGPSPPGQLPAFWQIALQTSPKNSCKG